MLGNAWNVPAMIGNMCVRWGGWLMGDNGLHCHMYAWGGSCQMSQVQHMDRTCQLLLLHKPSKPPSQCSLLCVNVTGCVRGLAYTVHLPQRTVHTCSKCTHSSRKYSWNTTLSLSNAEEQGSLIRVLLFRSNRIHKSHLNPLDSYRPRIQTWRQTI